MEEEYSFHQIIRTSMIIMQLNIHSFLE